MRKGVVAAIVAALAAPAAAQDKQPPYWASIASGEAMMRTGPGRNYPGVWLYKRRDLPIRVVKIYPNWRMIEDPGGHPRLDAGDAAQRPPHGDREAGRTAADPRQAPMQAAASATVPSRASSGASSIARDGWCHIAIGKREGYIRTSDIWGVSDGETVD